MNQIVFIIKPEQDACDRCKNTAYVNGEDDSDGYNIHVVDEAEYKQTRIVHKHCRCQAVKITDLEGIEAGEFVDKNTVDLVQGAGLSPNQLGGSLPANVSQTKSAIRPGKHFSKLIRHYHKQRNVGVTFYTVVVEPIIDMVNSFMRLFGIRS